ncbi:MAG: alpha/beta hydrolase [Bacteroidota bacterium]
MHTHPEIHQWQTTGTYLTTSKANGLNVFVRELGSREASPDRTLLLLHGFPESSFSYHLVAEGLLRRFDRIILFDFPGYGLSDKPRKGYSYSLLEQADVALEVWQQLGISGGHLLGHDMGDSVLTELVAREVEGALPERLSDGFLSYTLTNGSVVLELAELRIMQKLLLTSAGRWIAKLSTKGIFHHQIKSAHGDAPLEEQEIDRLWDMMLHNGGRDITYLTIKYLLDRRRYEASRWLPALGDTRVPIHICWGDKDHVARVEIAHHLKQHVCPEAHLSLMEGAGHFCQLGSPELWLQAVLVFYEERRGR